MQSSSRNKNPRGAHFDDLLLESIDVELGKMLGTKGREVAYRSLATYYALTKIEIPKRTEYFGSCLVQLFGVGGKVIGRAIAKNLYLKLGLDFPEKNEYGFDDYVENARSGRQNP